MKIKIEEYRGFEIRFDTDTESFRCDIDDSRSVKKSFASAKKFIDDHIKENTTFTPFVVEPNPKNSSYRNIRSGRITGLRKDGRYVIVNQEGEKGQVSEYDIDYYMIKDVKNEVVFEELKNLESDKDYYMKKFEKDRALIMSKLNVVSLREYKEKMGH